ncbi:hypothetical protein AXE65_06845, partial [Ventosimonas gracilis]
QSAIRNPQSAIRNPQSAIRNPQSAIRNPQWRYLALIFGVLFSFAVKAQGVVNVYNWYDFIDLSILPDFEQESGIKVNYQTFSSGQEILQLIEQKTPIDVAVVPHFLLQQLIRKQLLSPLEQSALQPARENLDAFIASRVNLVGAGDYAVPYLWNIAALGFNRSSLAKVLGDDFKEDWSLLFDAAQNSKIKGCGIAVADAPVELYATLLSYSGYPGLLEKTPLNRLRRLTRKNLLALRNNLRYIDSDNYLYDLGKGDLCLAMGWSGGISRAAQMNKDVQVVLPSNDGLTLSFEALVIPSTVKNSAAAHRFINFLSKPEISARNVNETLYGSPLKNIKPFLKPELQDSPLLQLTAQNKNRMQLLSTPGIEQQAEIDALWDAFVNQ